MSKPLLGVRNHHRQDPGHAECNPVYRYNIMKSNLLVIISSGISISLMGILIFAAPQTVRLFLMRNMECFLTIPPISVASYILVFKYHERFQNELPPLGALLGKLIQGAMVSFAFFLIMALIASLLYRVAVTIIK